MTVFILVSNLAASMPGRLLTMQTVLYNYIHLHPHLRPRTVPCCVVSLLAVGTLARVLAIVTALGVAIATVKLFTTLHNHFD